MSRHSLLVCLMVFGLVCPFVACTDEDRPSKSIQSQADPPNKTRTDVLWLTLCTLRADHVGAYGATSGNTPGLDRLAQHGVQFQNVTTVAPWTRPSIAAQITGKYPRALAIDVPREITDEDRATCCPDAGLRALDSSFKTAAEIFADNGYLTIGVSGNPNSSAAFGFKQGFKHFAGTGDVHWSSGYGARKLNADQINAHFLDRLPKSGERFFAHLTYVDVHPPRIVRGARDAAGNLVPKSYEAALRELDEAIAKLLDELKQRGRDDVLIVVSSDHGEGLISGPAERWGHGPHLYREHIEAIWIMSHPGINRRSFSEPVESIDILPTLLTLLDVEAPQSFDGRSHAMAIRGDSQPVSRPARISETAFGGTLRASIQREQYKLIETTYSTSSETLLFNLVDNPSESINLADNRPDQVQDLRSQLATWRRSHVAEVDGPGAAGQLDERTVNQLEVLGYAE